MSNHMAASRSTIVNDSCRQYGLAGSLLCFGNALAVSPGATLAIAPHIMMIRLLRNVLGKRQLAIAPQ